MPAIHTSHHTASAIINAPAAPSASAPQTSSESLAAIDAKYPNLEADLDKARDDVAATAGSDTWAGLSWMEKAVFFLLPLHKIFHLPSRVWRPPIYSLLIRRMIAHSCKGYFHIKLGISALPARR